MLNAQLMYKHHNHNSSFCWRSVGECKLHSIYQNRHIWIIIFNNCTSLSFAVIRDICCSRTQPYQMTRFVPNGTKSIQITMQKEILSMRTKRADHQIQCVCLTKTDNRWTHACSKLYLLLFIFIFGFSLTLSFVLPHNLINENSIMREAKHSYFLVQSYSMYLVENVLAFALIKYGFIIFVYTYFVWAFLHETQTYIQLKMGILPFSMMDFGACTRLSAHQLKNQHLNVPYFSFSFFLHSQRCVFDWMTSSWWICRIDKRHSHTKR